MSVLKTLPEKCIGLDLTDVIYILLQTAKTVNKLLKDYPELEKNAPLLFKDVGEVAKQGIGVIKANPALGASIYFGAILVTAYRLRKDAEEQLMKAQFQYDELDIIIEKEILPFLKLFDSAIKQGVDPKKMKGFYSARDEIFKTFDKLIYSLQKERKKIEERMIESTTGKTQSEILKYLSGGVGLSSTVVIAGTCLATGPAFPLLAGSSLMISSAIGYYLFGERQSTYRQSIDEVLVPAREKTLKAEKRLRQVRRDFNKVCSDQKIQNCKIIYFLIFLIFFAAFFLTFS